ncbi:MAG: glycosyltransferase [Flavisolibacter sp.]
MNVSLIIPTHNRSASLKKMLQTIERQSYPLYELEVIVVADGCKDDTIEMLNSYQSLFSLQVAELPGLGAASARNKGASMSSGRWLIFADDDMELSGNFIEEHIKAHDSENTVVIGYSPFKMEPKASIQRITLREWWEEKFQEMRQTGHRFTCSDLTSGNFSLSSRLFKEVGGFDTSLLCREDYELGFRLMEADARFKFAYAAKALHNDEVTNLRRSLQRKRSEGMADIRIKKTHPEFVNGEAIFYLSQRPRVKSVLLKVLHSFPGLCDLVAGFGARAMDYFEKFHLPIPWLKMNKRLHQYWYLRGLLQEAGSTGELKKLVMTVTQPAPADRKLRVDLEKGLDRAEQQIDQEKPLCIEFYYGDHFIGTIQREAGKEPIQGYHLRKLLRRNFYNRLAEVLYPHSIFQKMN